MTGELKSAFDSIRAEDSLKADTTRFLQDKIRARGGTVRRAAFGKYAAALACAIFILAGPFAYGLYATPAAYVDLDINPSVELTLNRFYRVIGAQAYNGDGAEIVKAASVKHKSYDDALVSIMDVVSAQGYLRGDGFVAVTLQTDNRSGENELLESIQSGLESYIEGHSHTAIVEVFSVSGDVRSHSRDEGISPAKYLAIQELITVDPTASIESCKGHSISEIKQLTSEHGNHHGDRGGSSAGPPTDGNGGHGGEGHERSPDVQGSGRDDVSHGGGSASTGASQGDGHHGGGDDGRHRGGR